MEGQEVRVQLELFEIHVKQSVKHFIKEIGCECLDSKKSEEEIEFWSCQHKIIFKSMGTSTIFS